MKDTSKSVHYFFTDEFINKYKNDYKQMRQEIVEFMTEMYHDRYFNRAGSTYYWYALKDERRAYVRYVNATKRLNKDLKLLKKFVKIGVLTNKDLKNFKKVNLKEMRYSVSGKVKDFFEENWGAMLVIGIPTVLVLGGVHHIGAYAVRRGWVNDCEHQISENICEDLGFSKFKYEAVDCIKDGETNYVEIYGFATKDVSSSPSLIKVAYEIDDDLYKVLDEKYKFSFDYNENGNMGELRNSMIYSKTEYKIFVEIEELTNTQVPYSVVEVSKNYNTNNTSYTYTDEMER